VEPQSEPLSPDRTWSAVPGAAKSEPIRPRARFRSSDRYRAEREWLRYEGTAQRRLFYELRHRFLARHPGAVGWSVDLGSGPGRFGPELSDRAGTRLVALDIGGEMLRLLSERWPAGPGAPPMPHLLRADAVRPPLAAARFETVVALGNLVGFAGADSDPLLDRALELVREGGTLLLEIAPGPGERSRYLRRLPAAAVARLLRAPTGAVERRVRTEGFDHIPQRRREPGGFRRVDPGALARRLEERGFRILEVRAVAPALGPDPERTEAVGADPKAWAHLVELEERLGSSPERWPSAAAVLVAAQAGGAAAPPSEG
jgi:hypothetical protein